MVSSRICSAEPRRCAFNALSGKGAVIRCMMFGPMFSTTSQSQPISKPPRTVPQLLPDPPTITMTHTRNVKRRGV